MLYSPRAPCASPPPPPRSPQACTFLEKAWLCITLVFLSHASLADTLRAVVLWRRPHLCIFLLLCWKLWLGEKRNSTSLQSARHRAVVSPTCVSAAIPRCTEKGSPASPLPDFRCKQTFPKGWRQWRSPTSEPANGQSKAAFVPNSFVRLFIIPRNRKYTTPWGTQFVALLVCFSVKVESCCITKAGLQLAILCLSFLSAGVIANSHMLPHLTLTSASNKA